MNNTRLLFVHALSPLHAGTGQGVGVIDLPIAREKATGLPFLPGSSLKGTLKGTLRSLCPEKYSEVICKSMFGPDNADIEANDSYASSVQVSDQRLLLLPIRSLAGTFAWVTSPYILRRFLRDSKDAQVKTSVATTPIVQSIKQCLLPSTDAKDRSKLLMDITSPMVYLEDLDLEAKSDAVVKAWAEWFSLQIFPGDEEWQQMLKERFCVVHDDVFNFLINTATEITARIRMQEKSKTVETGGLWYEEALPTETILSGIVLATPTQAAKKANEKLDIKEVFDILQGLTGTTMQLGGKATIGRGMCRVQIAQGED